MKLPSFFYFILLIIPMLTVCSAYGQEVSGTLRDKDSQEVIPYANIEVSHKYGAITNEEGDFSFTIPQNVTADSIRFSSLGYTTKTIAVRDLKSKEEVFLTRRLLQLDALFLGDERLSAREVMDSLRAHLETNHNFDGVQMKIFNRAKNSVTPHRVDARIKKTKNLLQKKVVKRFNTVVDSISRASLGHTTTNYTSILGRAALQKKMKMRLDKATYLLNQEEEVDLNDFTVRVINQLIEGMKGEHTFHVRTGLFTIGDSLDLAKRMPDMDKEEPDSIKTHAVKQVFSDLIDDVRFKSKEKEGDFSGFATDLGTVPDDFLQSPDDYQYEIEKVTAIDEVYVYKIRFWPARNFFGRKGKYEGSLFVSLEDYGILRMQYKLVEGAYGQKVSLGLFGVRFKEKEKSGFLIYQKNEWGGYLPKYVRFSGSSTIHLNRGLVMTENTRDRKNRVKIKVKMLLDFDNHYQNEWLFNEETTISPQDFSDFIENKGVREQRIDSYDSNIWENENTLMPTRAILKFKGGR